MIAQPLLFYVLIKPRVAPKTKGLIALPEDVRDAENATNTVGQIVSLGSLAFKAKSPGLDYSQEVNIPKPGDWVRYAKHSGQPFKVDTGGDTPEQFVLVSDTDILAVIPETEIGNHKGWVT